MHDINSFTNHEKLFWENGIEKTTILKIGKKNKIEGERGKYREK